MNKLKITSIELKEFEGKTLEDVYNYLKETYPDRLPFDGIDFYENEELKDGNYHFFFGSVFRDSSGHWCVPAVQWDGSSFDRFGYWLDGSWDSDDRAVVLEK